MKPRKILCSGVRGHKQEGMEGLEEGEIRKREEITRELKTRRDYKRIDGYLFEGRSKLAKFDDKMAIKEGITTVGASTRLQTHKKNSIVEVEVEGAITHQKKKIEEIIVQHMRNLYMTVGFGKISSQAGIQKIYLPRAPAGLRDLSSKKKSRRFQLRKVKHRGDMDLRWASFTNAGTYLRWI